MKAPIESSAPLESIAARSPRRADVAVAGGGLAGSALSAALARRGHRVAVFERDRFPRDKLCGEFLSFEAQRALEAIGCWHRVLDLQSPEIREAIFSAPSGRRLRLRLPRGCRGVSRRALDALLWRHALECGARGFEGAAVRAVHAAEGASEARVEVRFSGGERSGVEETWRASFVVGAHGRRDGLDRALEREFLARPAPWVGWQRHLRPRRGGAGARLGRELAGRVEIHAFEGGYCGLGFVETGEVNACALLGEPFLASLDSPGGGVVAEAMARASRPLARRLEALEASEPGRRFVARIPFGPKDRARSRLFYAGDAAGVIAPLCGDGQAVALRSGLLLAERLGRALESGGGERPGEVARLARRWDRAWRRELRWRVALGRGLQRMLVRERAAEWMVRAGGLFPALASLLVRATRGR